MDAFVSQSLTAMRLRRIAGMSLAELGCRGRQQGAKWIERIRVAPARRDPHATLQRHAPLLADGDSAVQAVRHTFDERFFAGTHDVAIAAHAPEHVGEIVADAEALLSGRFDLLGYTNLSFGDPIDWHLDPVWSRRSPQGHWSQIDPLDFAVVGDSKVVWELNRHQWMVRLAQATVLTGDTRFATHAIKAMLDWMAANPTGRGVNWSSSLEVGLRLISWSWVLGLLRRTDLLTPQVLVTVLASIHAHASHVQRYLSHYYSPNTHLTGEALGLFYAGTLFPQFDQAGRWRETGANTLIAEAARQISCDGIYFEQSTCYQRYSSDFYLHFLLLAARSGFTVPAHVRERLTRLVDFLAAIQDARGRMPGIGDADGGWLLPLCGRDADDCRGTMAVAAVVLERSDLAVGTSDAPEPLWLTGERPCDSAVSLSRHSTLYREGGYAILRSGAHDMIVDVGPVGSYGHGHADLLSVQCRIFGERCLVDPGTYGYTAEPVWREHFRSTAAHNTLTVDGRNQAIPKGPFGWDTRPTVTIRDWTSGHAMSLISAEHHAYPDMTHRRTVVATVAGQFIIIDELVGTGVHDVALTFQFAPMAVALTGLDARIQTPGGRSLTLASHSNAPLTASLEHGNTAPIRGWYSPDYGQRVAAPAVIYSATAALPVRIVTILTPQG